LLAVWLHTVAHQK